MLNCRLNNLPRLIIVALLLVCALGWQRPVAAANPPSESQIVPLRFIDGATGAPVKPESVVATPKLNRQQPQRMRRNGVRKDGRTSLTLEAGVHSLSVVASGYQPINAEFVVPTTNAAGLVFLLSPIELPNELQPDRIARLQKTNETLVLGYIRDEESGQALSDATIVASPSNRETSSNRRGFFQFFIPTLSSGDATNSLPSLTFNLTGFRTEKRINLDLNPSSQRIYQIYLTRGSGVNTVDETPFHNFVSTNLNETANPIPRILDHEQTDNVPPAPPIAPQIWWSISVTPKTNQPAPTRIPTNIRVLRQDGVTVDYLSLQTYCQRALPSEWIPGWGSTGPGNSGTNALLAGAVAIRTYAIGFVNNPANATYDICGTKTCQAYQPNAADNRTTAAVNATANFVMTPSSGGRIPYKLTEYSAENNQLGKPCGDGFTAPYGSCVADEVCTGETQFGHGRGMCQWGTARWASGRKMSNRQTSDATTNGFPLRDWIWICHHYYPELHLAEGAPLSTNDYVQVQGTTTLSVRKDANDGISGGLNSRLINVKSNAANGMVIGGPVRITSDGMGYTWWQVRWFDTNRTVGWSPENWLERTTPPWNAPPLLAPLPVITANEGDTIKLTNHFVATANTETILNNFESYSNGTTLVATQPSVTGSTNSVVETSQTTAQFTRVTNDFPDGNASARVWHVAWKTPTNTSLSLKFSLASAFPETSLPADRRVSFDIYSDRAGTIGFDSPDTTNNQPLFGASIPASNWTTVTLIPADLPTASALSVTSSNSEPNVPALLRQVRFMPSDDGESCNLYIDNLSLWAPKFLTYSLSNAPAGATIDQLNGEFSWRINESTWPGNYDVVVRVADNNLPPQSDAQRLRIVVRDSTQPPLMGTTFLRTCEISSWTGMPLSNPLSLVPERIPNQLAFTVLNDGNNLQFQWSSVIGEKYRLESTKDLGQASWIPTTEEVKAVATVISVQDYLPDATSYFRVRQIAER